MLLQTQYQKNKKQKHIIVTYYNSKQLSIITVTEWMLTQMPYCACMTENSFLGLHGIIDNQTEGNHKSQSFKDTPSDEILYKTLFNFFV